MISSFPHDSEDSVTGNRNENIPILSFIKSQWPFFFTPYSISSLTIESRCFSYQQTICVAKPSHWSNSARASHAITFYQPPGIVYFQAYIRDIKFRFHLPRWGMHIAQSRSNLSLFINHQQIEFSSIWNSLVFIKENLWNHTNYLWKFCWQNLHATWN